MFTQHSREKESEILLFRQSYWSCLCTFIFLRIAHSRAEMGDQIEMEFYRR